MIRFAGKLAISSIFSWSPSRKKIAGTEALEGGLPALRFGLEPLEALEGGLPALRFGLEPL